MPKRTTASKSALGVDVMINGELHHLTYLQWEYPQKPGVPPGELAPGMPGFYTISARGRAQTIRWMEQCFASGAMTIEVRHKSEMSVTYSHGVDSVSEIPPPSLRERLMGRLSASFGFYQCVVLQPAKRTWPKLIAVW